MASYPDIDTIDTNIRHAKGIIEVIDNIGNKLDSDPDAIRVCLCGPPSKHLREATDEIEDVGEKNLSDLLSKVDSDPFGDDEEDDDDQTILAFEIRVEKDGGLNDHHRPQSFAID
jgi:hypothetical protein